MEREDIIKTQKEGKIVKIVLVNGYSYTGKIGSIFDPNPNGESLIYFYDNARNLIKFVDKDVTSIETKKGASYTK